MCMCFKKIPRTPMNIFIITQGKNIQGFKKVEKLGF